MGIWYIYPKFQENDRVSFTLSKHDNRTPIVNKHEKKNANFEVWNIKL